MFLGGNQQVDKTKGKRTSGFAARKEGEFSLGWTVSNQLNDFQVKKQRKEQNMAIKVTDQKSQGLVIDQQTSALTFQEKCKELIQENPHITKNQLQERMALWEMSNQQRQPKQAPKTDKGTATFKPKQNQSARNAIYGGNEQQPPVQRGASKNSRRNEGTFSFGDYNYFQDKTNNRLK